MPTMSRLEQRFFAKGRQEGLQEGVLDILGLRFGSVPPDLTEAVQKIDDRKRLKSLHLAAVQIASLDEFRLLL